MQDHGREQLGPLGEGKPYRLRGSRNLCRSVLLEYQAPVGVGHELPFERGLAVAVLALPKPIQKNLVWESMFVG
jgi:hypothetical protein